MFWLVIGAAVVLAADPVWIAKPANAWTEREAREIITNSPWARTIRPRLIPLQTEDERRESGNMGPQRGIGFDGFADDRPRVTPPHGVVDIVKPEAAVPAPTQSVSLQLRWESALPVRVAEMKARFSGAPTVTEDAYALAVYGIPDARFKGGDPKSLGNPFKSQAFLRRSAKPDVKPFSVEVFQGADGLVVVYLFPLSAEITEADRHIEFDAQIGRIAIAQTFNVEQMHFQGKFEL